MYADSELPTASSTTWRRAAKPHACIECGRVIAKGDRYEYTSGIWDGAPSSYRTCTRCVRLRGCHYAGMVALDEVQCYAIGGLIGEIGELSREEPAYREAFRRRYVATPATDAGKEE